MTRYEVVRADSNDEAKRKSKFREGEPCMCVEIETVANNDGTYSVFPIVEPIVKPEPKRMFVAIVEPSREFVSAAGRLEL